ncbi:hypothetical protein CDFC105_43990 [Clostridioides difficile]|nr:hypothetical protein CDFC105_43990 [Clostridioides difficile]
MMRRPPRSTRKESSAASDVYKRQTNNISNIYTNILATPNDFIASPGNRKTPAPTTAVSYTHLRAHETRHDLVCRLLLEKKKNKNS